MKTITKSNYTTLALLVLGCFVLSHTLQAVSPAPDGGYPNFTTAEGDNALNGLTTGSGNTGVGWYSLFGAGASDFNTGLGAGTLVLNTADSNTAVGAGALLLNTTGMENTAVGTDALVFNDNGFSNNAVGAFALFHNIDGISNNAFGNAALQNNMYAVNNTAIGDAALTNNDVTGNNSAMDNTAVGAQALFSNMDGNDNTAVGYFALANASLSAGDNPNTAVGSSALAADINGTGNTAVGAGALQSNTGSDNTAIGFQAGLGGDGNVYIGAEVSGQFGGEANHTYIRNINTTTVSGSGTDTVTVDLTTGLLGHLSSSRRYKEGIQPMDNVSETLYRLKPVMYCYKKEIDPSQLPAFGLIAEDVAEVNPALVARDCQGQPESVHYEMVNAMLLNEFLKEHKTVQEQGRIIARQQEQIDALTAGLQKVSAQRELNKSTAQTALTNR